MLNGWRLTGIVSSLLGVMALYFLTTHAWDAEGLRLAIRSTARTSLVLFALAFSAAAMFELVPNDATRWQRRNRRYLGVSFAVSHLIHLVALISLARLDRELFWALTNPANVVLGGIAYGFIFAMAATSFDTTAAWLGPRKWRLLHLMGGWYIWITFAVATIKRIPQGPIYWGMSALVLAVGVARLVAMSRRNRRRLAVGAA